MSNKASDYTWQLKVGSTPRKMLLTRMAKMADGERHSYYVRVDLIARYLETPKNKVSGYLDDLQASGYVSVLERTYSNGGQKESRVFIHGPWDSYGGHGTPFEEIEPHYKDSNFAAADPVEITPKVLAELRERYNEYAEEDGMFRDGAARSRWRLGSRAHSLVCWYGLGNTVTHDGRPARVTAITNTGERGRPIPEQVDLTYLDEAAGTAEGVLVEKLSEPAPTPEQSVETQASDQPQGQPEPQNPSSEGSDQMVRGGSDQMVRGVVTKRSGHGMTKRSPLESSFNAKRKSSSSGGRETEGHGPEEEEESPSALGGIEGAAAVVMERTDATADEARALVDKFVDDSLKRGKVLGQPDVYVRRFKDGDLGYHLGLLRRQRSPQPRTGASGDGRAARCTEHYPNVVPCSECRADLNIGGADAETVLALYVALGENAATLRPDLAQHPRIQDLAASNA